VLALVVWFCLRTVGNKTEANRAMADAIDAWTRPRIEKKRAKLNKLKDELSANDADIAAAENEVEDIRAGLEAKYTALDLSPEEIAERTEGLRI
jgi:hypothetical protein